MNKRSLLTAILVSVIGSLAMIGDGAIAQSRLPGYPGYTQYQKMTAATRGGQPYKSGAVNVTWTDGGKAFDYQWDGKSYHFDIAANQAQEVAKPERPADDAPAAGGRGAGRGAGRGRRAQVAGGGGSLGGGGIARRLFDTTNSPNGKFKGFSR